MKETLVDENLESQKVEKEENRVLLGYATMEEKDIEEAMKKLKEIWKI